MTKFYKVKDNEWQMPVMDKYKLACCDCGLVHNIDFKVIDDDTHKKIKNASVLFKAKRNIKLTKELRKEMYEETYGNEDDLPYWDVTLNDGLTDEE
jgi:hypothetical protein